MGTNPRAARVAQSMRQTLGELIRQDVKDPRVGAAGMLSINNVELNRDLSVAYVFVSFLGGDEAAAEPAVAALGRVAGALRGKLARSMGLKRAPELRFRHDTSGEFGLRLSEIIRDDERGGGE